MSDEGEIKLGQKILAVLKETKDKIYECFDDFGFDAAYFDIEIDLKCQVNDLMLRIHEKEKALGQE